MADNNVNRSEILFNRIKKEIPGVKIVLHKNSRLMTVIHWILRNVFRQKHVSESYTTTIAKTIYVPNTFNKWHPNAQYKLLRHELIHLRQFRKWPFPFLGIPVLWWFNCVIFSFFYLFVLPLKVTFRARFEKQAYTQSLLSAFELGQINLENPDEWKVWAEDMERQFGTGAYFFMARKGEGAKFAYDTLELIKCGIITSNINDVVCPVVRKKHQDS